LLYLGGITALPVRLDAPPAGLVWIDRSDSTSIDRP
jgi:hypothetical protein